MAINNFEQLREMLNFTDKNDFYFVQILKRRKDQGNSDIGSNSYVVKTYYIKSKEQLDKDMAEMILLADFQNARVYINLNKRNFKKCSLQTARLILDQMCNEDYISAPKAFNTVCGRYSDEEDKKWVIDYDEKDLDKLKEVENYINTLQPKDIKNKIYCQVKTKNGYHLITSPFNLQDFKIKYSDIDVHKQNPTILYMPTNEDIIEEEQIKNDLKKMTLWQTIKYYFFKMMEDQPR
ncbi:hypothetical protein M0Q50_07755 [bacterium]|jgi:hypothetical protein|nr:hypothetical protein [bacterium]